MREIYDALNLPRRITRLIEQYTDNAVRVLDTVSLQPGWKDYFTSLALSLNDRAL